MLNIRVFFHLLCVFTAPNIEGNFLLHAKIRWSRTSELTGFYEQANMIHKRLPNTKNVNFLD